MWKKSKVLTRQSNLVISWCWSWRTTLLFSSLVLSCKRAFWKDHALTHLSANKRNKAEIYHWVLPVHMFNMKGSWLRDGSLGSGLSSQCKHHSREIMSDIRYPKRSSHPECDVILSFWFVVGPLIGHSWPATFVHFWSHSWRGMSWGYTDTP